MPRLLLPLGSGLGSKMKKVLMIIAGLVIVVGIGAYIALPRMEESYQKWADCTRINDIYYIAGLIEEFKQKKGYYPLAEDYEEPDAEGWVSVPVMVNITHRELAEQYLHMPGNMSGRVAPTTEFVEELTQVLGRKIEIPSDPQNVPTFAPNFYQYIAFPNRNYVLSAYLYTSNKNAVELGPHYNKYSVGSEEKKSEKEVVLNFLKLGVKPHRCERHGS